jgi:hypothetical protein
MEYYILGIITGVFISYFIYKRIFDNIFYFTFDYICENLSPGALKELDQILNEVVLKQKLKKKNK